MKRSKRWIWNAIGLGVLALCVGLFVVTERRPVGLAPGTMIRYDDFDFTANSAEEVEPGLYALEIKVENHAKVVDFQYRPEVVRVATGQGIDLEPVGQTMGATLSPDDSSTRAMRFKGPAELKELWVRFEFANGFFTMIDRATLGNRQIKLPVRQR